MLHKSLPEFSIHYREWKDISMLEKALYLIAPKEIVKFDDQTLVVKKGAEHGYILNGDFRQVLSYLTRWSDVIQFLLDHEKDWGQFGPQNDLKQTAPFYFTIKYQPSIPNSIEHLSARSEAEFVEKIRQVFTLIGEPLDDTHIKTTWKELQKPMLDHEVAAFAIQSKRRSVEFYRMDEQEYKMKYQNQGE